MHGEDLEAPNHDQRHMRENGAVLAVGLVLKLSEGLQPILRRRLNEHIQGHTAAPIARDILGHGRFSFARPLADGCGGGRARFAWCCDSRLCGGSDRASPIARHGGARLSVEFSGGSKLIASATLQFEFSDAHSWLTRSAGARARRGFVLCKLASGFGQGHG